MDTWFSTIAQFFTAGPGGNLIQAALILVGGFLIGRILANLVGRVPATHLDRHMGLLLRRVIFYGILLLAFTSALHQMGFKLGVLLGAAGIISVAIGFASQTSASNLISGLFLVWERPFSVGDTIRVGTTVGEVVSIDLLSVKLRTFDNLFVRLPNETLIKTEMTNLSRFPIRRLDLQIGVAYKEDIKRVRKVLDEVATANPLCLEEPKPQFLFLGFGDSALNLQFNVWAQRENFLEMRNSLQIEIKEAFDREGIEIPFPHRTLYAGSVTDPFPVQVVDRAGGDRDNP
ncbi:mechanosensitive ion channel-like protein [Alkalispirillum mobile]|uniref:Small-conductance mechanosensitive channel n=1 Tax=Alkalispirillum mobile TaxID=85925 RepID=A0A498C745_9GAMM|nr:mechanosensitive ion channel family protein [Alkalispirillum mobile]RLK48358.1 mechanosensitive ion channel-like protein [Alkalispirillum mobile]